MHSFERKFISEWRRLGLPTTNAVIVAAVSGGADSVSMLQALCSLRSAKKLDVRVVAVHVNHRLRGPESDADEKFVRDLTTSLGVEFAVKHVDVPQEGNLEQNARNSRYQAILSVAQAVSASIVATGHTINDQAETFLMNLIRGSGPSGLKGMSPVRVFKFHDDGLPEQTEDSPELPFPSDLLLVRPLLMWAQRGATEQYCSDNEIVPRHDTMNDDTAFKRVRIRRVLLPLLKDMNPNIVETLAATAERMSKVAVEPAPDDLGKKLLVADIRAMDEASSYEIIRSWLTARRGGSRRISTKHIAAIDSLARSTRSGRVSEIPGGRVVRSGGELRYETNKVEKPTS